MQGRGYQCGLRHQDASVLAQHYLFVHRARVSCRFAWATASYYSEAFAWTRFGLTSSIEGCSDLLPPILMAACAVESLSSCAVAP